MMGTLEDRLAADAVADAVADLESHWTHVATYWHADGSATVVAVDEYPGDTQSPREWAGNVATLVQLSDRHLDIDEDDAGLGEVRSHYGRYDERPNRAGWTGWYYDRHIRFAAESRHDRDAMVRRYLAIYRPDILHYVDYVSLGEAYGWGYVTADAWRAAMGEDYAGELTPAAAFDSEVSVYDQWARGEVYTATHVEIGSPVIKFGPEGAYVAGYDVAEDTVGGFLGYDDTREIAATFTDSPVTGERDQ